MILHNLLKQLALWKHTGIPLFPREQVTLYGLLFASPPVLALHALIPRAVWAAVPLGVGQSC